jgi:hypothetical protein
LRIERKILTTHFACDLAACKGACCTFPGGSGPPVRPEEAGILEKAWKAFGAQTPLPHRRLVESKGLLVEDDGELTIRCLDERACVFVVYEEGIARCSIQRAYDAGLFSWPKPLSCHLFPLRIRGDKLRYEHFTECEPALEQGETLKLPLLEFLRTPLIRAFGESVYEGLRQRGHLSRNGEH